jgi:hypothetical protein
MCGAQQITSWLLDATELLATMARKHRAAALADASALLIELGISGGTMARITVKDLQQSDTLDRQAMLAIAGGSRAGTRPTNAPPAKQPVNRLVDYPPGFSARVQAEANAGRS